MTRCSSEIRMLTGHPEFYLDNAVSPEPLSVPVPLMPRPAPNPPSKQSTEWAESCSLSSPACTHHWLPQGQEGALPMACPGRLLQGEWGCRGWIWLLGVLAGAWPGGGWGWGLGPGPFCLSRGACCAPPTTSDPKWASCSFWPCRKGAATFAALRLARDWESTACLS